MLGRIFQTGTLPIGIDIGARSVKMLQLRQSPRGASAVAAAEFDLGLSDDHMPGSDAWLSAVVAGIQRHLEAARFAGLGCVIGLEDRLVRVRSIRQPDMPDDEADRAIRLDCQNRLGFDEGEPIELGWMRAGEVRVGKDVREEIIIAGSKTQVVERLAYAIAESGLRPMFVEPGFCATARTFSRKYRRADDQESVRMVVDVGWRTTGVMLLRGSTIAFYKPLEMGGLELTKAAAEKLGLEFRTVSELRRQRCREGQASDPRVDRAIFEAVRPIIGDLAQEISLCLRYYSVTFRGAKPSTCMVVGGEAREPKLIETIQGSLHLETLVGDPFEAIDVSGTSLLGREGHAGTDWSVAAGLSLRGAERGRVMRDRRRVRMSRQSAAPRQADNEARAAA